MKDKKGISLISLVVAVTLILIIAGILLYNSRNYVQILKLKNLHSDIQILEEQIEVFYSKHGSLPVLEIKYDITLPQNQKNPNDGEEYYVINVDVLDNIRLNYGKEFVALKNDKANPKIYTDVYVVNIQSHTVYYVKGISVDGTTYHRDNKEYSKVDWQVPIQEVAYVGDYVDYHPQTETTSYQIKEVYSGSPDQTVAQDTTLKWRILNINEKDGTIDLISEVPTNNTVSLTAARGYNNGVYLLNDLCNKLYSNSSIGAKARSLNIEDIEDKIKVDEVTGKKAYESFTQVVQYGDSRPYSGSYPVQWKNDTGIKGESEQRELIAYETEEAAKANGDNFEVTQTYWSMGTESLKENYIETKTRNTVDSGENNIYYQLLSCNGDVTYGNFWLASRGVSTNYIDNAIMFIRRMYNGIPYSTFFHYTGSSMSGKGNYAVRPVVTIQASDIDISKDYEANGNIWSLKK